MSSQREIFHFRTLLTLQQIPLHLWDEGGRQGREKNPTVNILYTSDNCLKRISDQIYWVRNRFLNY